MRNDDLLNDILARKLAPFDDRFHDTTERARDLDHPTELGCCEIGECASLSLRRSFYNDAVKVLSLDDGRKLAACNACDIGIDECLEDARREGAEILSRRARAVDLFKRAAIPAAFVAAAILQQVVCQ